MAKVIAVCGKICSGKSYYAKQQTNTVLQLIRNGHNYPREFKSINNINVILDIFEAEKE